MRDPNTGEMSGVFYELMQEIGKSLNLEVKFSHEIDWSLISEDLKNGKSDVHCAGVWATPARGRTMAFTDPITFLPSVAFVRADDKRFDFNIDAANSSDISIAIIDDDVSEEIATRDFPMAKRVSRAQIGAVEDLIFMVMSGKADITFDGPNRFGPFNATNPDKVRMVPTQKPVRIFPNTFAVDIHENELQNMLNTALHQMQDNGTVDRLLKKYQSKGYDTGFLLPVSRPYDWTKWNSEMNKGIIDIKQ